VEVEDMGVTRSFPALVVALAAAIALVLSSPSLASACTGCPTGFQEFVQGANRIVLARYAGQSSGRYDYRVIDVLKGSSPGTLRFKYNPVGPPAPSVGSRWLISTEVGPDGILRANVIFPVSRDGSVNTTDGEGGVDAPDTLAGWYAAIAKLPDSSTATSPEGSASVNAPRQLPVLPLIVVGVLAALATLRRLTSTHMAVDLRRRRR
jgi:hypothetical protein